LPPKGLSISVIRAETASFATERHEMLCMTGVTAHPQKAIFYEASFEVILKFSLHVSRQRITLLLHMGADKYSSEGGRIQKDFIAVAA